MSFSILLKIITVLVFAIVVLTPLFYLKEGVYPFILSKTLFFQTLIEILFALWIALAIGDRRYRPPLPFLRKSDSVIPDHPLSFPRKRESSNNFLDSRVKPENDRNGKSENDNKSNAVPRLTRNPVLPALAVFLAVLFFTSLIGEDFHRSFWSSYERVFGIFTILHLAAFALVLSSLRRELPWRRIFQASVITSVVVAALAMTEIRVENLLLDQPIVGRAGSTFGNPTFLAGYLLWNIFIGIYLLLYSWVKSENDNKHVIPDPDRESSFNSLDSRIKSENDRNGNPARFLSKLGTAAAKYWPAPAVLFNAFVLVFVTQTRGDILGLAAGIFVLLILFAINPPVKSRTDADKSRPITSNYDKLRSLAAKIFSSRSAYAIVLCLAVSVGSVFWFTRENAAWNRFPGIERFREISLESEALQPRLIAARAAWNGFLERPLTGFGWENFNIVFNKHYDPRLLRANYQETRFDKPHNFFLEDLASGGAPLAAARMLLFAALVYVLWRGRPMPGSRTASAGQYARDSLFAQVITAALASYVVRSLFVFDTLGPSLMFFLLIGFLAAPSPELTPGVIPNEAGGETGPGIPRAPRNDKARNRNGAGISRLSFVIALVASLIFAYFANVNTLLASRNHFYGFIYIGHKRAEESIGYFRKALGAWSPYRWNFVRDYAAVMSEAHFNTPGLVPDSEVLYAVSEMEKVANSKNKDAYNHYMLVDVYNQISDINEPALLAAAESAAAKALELSPNRQQVYFSLAKTKTLKGDYPAAIELARYALSLDEKVADAHFYYGLLLLAHGETDEGDNELKEAIRLGRKWKNYGEPLTVGNLMADAGRYGDALELYAVSVIMAEPQGEAALLEPKAKLGIAFYLLGKFKEARDELQWVADRFDFRESPIFGDLKPILDEVGVVY